MSDEPVNEGLGSEDAAPEPNDSDGIVINEPTPKKAAANEDLKQEKLTQFSWRLALVATVLAAIPMLIAWLATPSGGFYLGAQFNADDHMVYAAWMHQAMEGRFMFENRFAVEQQPGLTIHLYFWALGTIARVFEGMGPEVALPLVANLARIGFTFLFVILLGKFVKKLEFSIFASKLAMILGCFGGGLGFMVWEPFGRLNMTSTNPVNGFLERRLPVDVWQPEVLVFPSMLTNGLFMVSLCLILWAMNSVVAARESWKSVLPGATAMLLLMNIHSYDVLLVTFVLIGFLVATLVSKEFSGQWLARAVVIGLGTIPAALWFMNVLSQDTVFQARAATETFSPTFRQILVGIFPLVLLSLPALASGREGWQKWAAPGSLVALFGALAIAATGFDSEKAYFMTQGAFAASFVAAIGVVALGARKGLGWNLFYAWAVIGAVAPFFPQLFQRKLAMGLALPWAVLAALGVEVILRRIDQQVPKDSARNIRNLVTALAVAVMSASSLYWFQRELTLIRSNVATTKVQTVFYSADVKAIVRELHQIPGRKVVAARPGVSINVPEDPFIPPYIPDLNPILSGLAGATTYAGHWSETPDYGNRRQDVERLFAMASPEEIREILTRTGIEYVVIPNPEAFGELPATDLSPFGTTIYQGQQFSLMKIDRERL
ncbi:MAG: hypothetical protein LCH41_09485 [Armatimonadetes bacterium]|nr:hypothetical protein [Armatimonadota bacterium]